MMRRNYNQGDCGESSSLYSERVSLRNSYLESSGSGKAYNINKISLSYDGESDYEVL